jgi:hypothetical protein
MGPKIRIPARIWNAYQPPACAHAKPAVPRLKLRLRVPAPPSTSAIHLPDPGTGENETEPTHCKVKLFRFHYGGPQRQRKGQWQNEITYEQPCLQPSCPNCQRWHAHLLQRPQSTDTGGAVGRPAQEPISPEVDPRILDGSWQYVQHQSHYLSAEGLSVLCTPADVYTKTPVLTPVVKSFPPYAHRMYQAPVGGKYTIFLPTALVSRTTTTASVRSLWRTTPRKRYTARLFFTSNGGKDKFETLIKARERKEKRREYDRARRARLREMRNSNASSEKGVDMGMARTVTCRSRQRVRLVFGTENGRPRFTGAIARRQNRGVA